MFSPELLSPQETFDLLIEIARKAQSSEELLERLVADSEFLNFIAFVSNYSSRASITKSSIKRSRNRTASPMVGRV